MPLGSNKKFLTIALFVVVAGLFALFNAPEGTKTTGADPDDKQLVALGEGVYRDSCASCHGANLEGQPNWRSKNADGTLPAPPHDENGHTWHHPDRVLFEITKQGGQAFAPGNFKSAMPGFGDVLDDRQIWAVLAYIKTQWPAAALQRQQRISAQSQ